MTEIIQLGYGHYLIQSRTNPEHWYAVEDGTCTCRASDCKVRCWHLEAIEEIEKWTAMTGSSWPSSLAACFGQP